MKEIVSIFLSDVVTLFDELDFSLTDSVTVSVYMLLTDSFVDLMVPVDAIIVNFSDILSELEPLFFDVPVTTETLPNVLLEVGFPEDVVILSDTGAVVSNVVV